MAKEGDGIRAGADMPAAAAAVPGLRETALLNHSPDVVPARLTKILKAGAALSFALAGPAIFVLIWWAVVAAEIFPRSVLPPPSRVAAALWEWMAGTAGSGPYAGTLFQAVQASAERVALGYAIGVALGVGIGVPAGYYRLVGQLVDPLIHLLRPIPVTAWVPLSLVFFGFGMKGAVFLIALGCFFPIFVNTTEGVRGANRTLVRVGSMLGAKDLELLRLFIFPASLPAIFVGLRIGMGIAWVLVIVAELLSVKAGIGYTLLDAYSFNRYDVVIAAMIVVGLLGFVSDRIIVVIQWVVLRWHREMSIHAE